MTTNYTELKLQIMHLKSLKFDQEVLLEKDFKEFVYALDPAMVLKNTIHRLAGEKEVKFDLTKVGVNMGMNFLIYQLFGKQNSVKGFLSSLAAEKLSASLVDVNLSKVMPLLGQVLAKFRPNTFENQEDGNKTDLNM